MTSIEANDRPGRRRLCATRRLLSKAMSALMAIALATFVARVAIPAAAYAAPSIVSTYLVNSTGDATDAVPGNGACATSTGVCTLRAAIVESNAHAGYDKIGFAVGTGLVTIQPTSLLPVITDPALIDATTQPGYVDHPIVQLNGRFVGGNASGLRVNCGGTTIRGFSITDWGVSPLAVGHGILLTGAGGANTVVGNYLGLAPDGTAAGNGNTGAGLQIANSNDNVVGGSSPGDRNIISGNANAYYPVYGIGVWITGTSTRNVVQGNYIGTSPDGSTRRGNAGGGVLITSPGNRIGVAGTGNVISGNPTGVTISGAGATSNRVQANIVGLDATGTVALRNADTGIAVTNASNNELGGTNPGEGNVISGNGSLVVGSPSTLNIGTGVDIGAASGQSASGNTVEGNRFGTDLTGTVRKPGYNAIVVGASGNVIGGTTATTPGGACTGACNQIAGNQSHAVVVGAPDTIIEGNQFGLGPDGHIVADGTGTSTLRNGGSDILLLREDNVVGGATPAARNVVSGALLWGVQAANGSHDSVIEGNYIGTDSSGSSSVPNGAGGVFVASANVVVGGTRPSGATDCSGPCNLVSGNKGEGIELSGAGATGSSVTGNFVGTNPSGMAAVPNIGEAGILVETVNTVHIGGAALGQGNLVSGNQTNGIELVARGLGAGTAGVHVEGNLVGTATDGSSHLPNTGHGVFIGFGANHDVIGGVAPGARNIVAYNGRDGIEVNQDTGNDNQFRRNSIHDNGSLGIDRAPHDIPNPNDHLDGDLLNFVGLDDLQNWPVVQTAKSDGATATEVTGLLDSTPNSAFTLEFFANDACDPSGYGEGQDFIGDASVTTNGAGQAPYDVTALAPVAPGRVITATATNAAGNTSEFSKCGPATVPMNNYADLRIAKTVNVTQGQAGDPVEYTLTITNVGPNTAHNVQVSDPLAVGSFVLSAVAPTGICTGTTTVSCALGDIASGGSATVTVDVILQGPGPWSNTASISSTTADPDPSNNVSTVTLLPAGQTDPCRTGPDRDADGISDACDPLIIGDFVWRDANQNGLQDAGEPGIQGVVVDLDGPNGLHLTTTTDPNGLYSFSLPAPVTGNYTVTVDAANFATNAVLEDWTATTPGPSLTHPVTVFDDVTFDFGYYLNGGGTADNCPGVSNPNQSDRDGDGIGDACDPLIIGDFVWRDANQNGLQDAGEPGIQGVVVDLDGPNGLHLTTTTDPNGLYSFSLPAPVTGNYTVTVDAANFATNAVLEDWTATTPGPSLTHPVTVFDDVTFDFGYYLNGGGTADNCPGVSNPNQSDRDGDGIGDACDPLIIGDRVWADANHDNVQDPSEHGIAGVTVQLTGPGGSVIGTAVTVDDGFYSFSLVAPSSGTYTVTVVPSNFASGGALHGWGSTDSVNGDARARTLGCCDDLTFDLGYAKLPPVVSAASAAHGVEGSPISLMGSVTDPAGASDTLLWTYAVTSGVDAGASCSFGTPSAAVTTITCTDDGVFTATLTASDGTNPPVTRDVVVTVDNAKPALTITSPAEGTLYAAPVTVLLTSTYTDPGANDTHVCSINWDDGTTSTFAGAHTCNSTHAFSAAGVYTVTVTVTDDDGASDTKMVMVIVYDPTAGFVTGGGWIVSPPGAYRPDQTITGRADFGFVSRYQKGASVPTGETEFQFQLAGLNFHSSSYDWLVVSGTKKAQYKGIGTVNGSAGYAFLLTVYDNGSSGDKFRIKIWQQSTGTVIYDNNYGAPTDIDSASPTTISGGSIVIHS